MTRFHPNLILGGTYSGQIVLWDNRVQKRTPIQRTPLSSLAHTVRYTNFYTNFISHSAKECSELLYYYFQLLQFSSELFHRGFCVYFFRDCPSAMCSQFVCHSCIPWIIVVYMWAGIVLTLLTFCTS